MLLSASGEHYLRRMCPGVPLAVVSLVDSDRAHGGRRGRPGRRHQLLRPRHQQGTDFNVFYLGGHLVTEAPEELYERASKRGSNYTYLNPPVFAILMWPLAALPIGASAVAWFVVNVVCTGHSAWILSRLLAPGPDGGFPGD